MSNEADLHSYNHNEKYIEFNLGDEHYAIPLLSVREVIAVPEVTSIPYTPPYFKGISNLRGQIISIMDLREKFGMKAEKSNENVVIICDFNSISMGIIIDKVNAVLSISEESIRQKPEIKSNVSSDYIVGVSEQNKKLVLLMDIAHLLDVKDQSAIKKMAKAA